jgi:hypothetical protein
MLSLWNIAEGRIKCTLRCVPSLDVMMTWINNNWIYILEQNLFFASLSYSVLMWLIKFAFLGYFSNLLEVFSKRQKRFYIFVWIYAVGTLVAAMIIQLAYCRPVDLNWYVLLCIVQALRVTPW